MISLFFSFCFYLFGRGKECAVLLMTTEKCEEPKRGVRGFKAGLVRLRRAAGLDRPQRAPNAGPGHVDAAGVTPKCLTTGGTGRAQTGHEKWCRVLEALAAADTDLLDAGSESRSARAGAKGLGGRATPELQAIAVYRLFGMISTEQGAWRVDRCSGSGHMRWKCSELRDSQGDGEEDVSNNAGQTRQA